MSGLHSCVSKLQTRRIGALRAIEAFLIIQAHIKIVLEADGTVTVRAIKRAKQAAGPNQSREQTLSSGTSPAEEPRLTWMT